MATLSLTGQCGAMVNWQIIGLGNTWDDNNYSQCGLFLTPFSEGQSTTPTNAVGYGYPPTNGTSYNTSVYTNGAGLLAGNNYTLYAGARTATSGTWWSAGVSSVYLPTVPAGAPTVTSATASAGRQVSLTWTSLSGATGYDIYANKGLGDEYKTYTSGTSVTVTMNDEYTNYTMKVTARNACGTSSTYGSRAVRTLDETNPTVSQWYVAQALSQRLSVVATAYDSASSGLSSGLAGYYLYISYNGGSSWSSVRTMPNTGTLYYTYENGTDGVVLTNGVTVQLGVRAYDASGRQSAMSVINGTPVASRPSNFSWTTAKTSGAFFNLTATEWNNFTARINLFRAYKNLGEYAFSQASQNAVFGAWMFNQAVTAISAMSPPTSPPAGNKVTGEIIRASDLNLLVTSLNSIA